VCTKEFTELKIGTGKALKCKAEDGLELDGAIFTPKSLAGKKGPHQTAVIIHGGPYHRQSVGEDPNFHWLEWMLSLGYVVIVPNYRGSSLRGAEFAEKVHGNIDASHADVICLIKQGIKDGVVDEKRVAVTGWSQGGYLSFFSATRSTTFKFACAIAGAGVTHCDTMAMTSDIPTFERARSGSAPWDGKQDANFKANPIFGVKDVQFPLLILHGEEDARVTKEQSIGFHRGMMAYGKECQLVMYPCEGH
jgi:dipeptidyl aminopeptidase/acylaminoacyl peptidase